MLLDVINVVVLQNYILLLTFENGEVRKFDMQQLIDVKPYHRLKESGYFKCAKVEYGTVVWPGEIDVAPETLYDNSQYIETVTIDTLAQSA